MGGRGDLDVHSIALLTASPLLSTLYWRIYMIPGHSGTVRKSGLDWDKPACGREILDIHSIA